MKNRCIERTGAAENFSKGSDINGFLSNASGANAIVNRTSVFSFKLKP
jgi:hypothetical protein